VRVESNGARPDLSKPALTVVKVGQKVLLSIYLEIDEGMVGTPLTFSFMETTGATRVLSKTTEGKVPASLPAQVRETIKFQPRKQGKYRLTGTVTYGGESQHQSTSFTVMGPTKHQCVTIAGSTYCNS
jgi:hypothetical protein